MPAGVVQPKECGRTHFAKLEDNGQATGEKEDGSPLPSLADHIAIWVIDCRCVDVPRIVDTDIMMSARLPSGGGDFREGGGGRRTRPPCAEPASERVGARRKRTWRPPLAPRRAQRYLGGRRAYTPARGQRPTRRRKTDTTPPRGRKGGRQKKTNMAPTIRAERNGISAGDGHTLSACGQRPTNVTRRT